VSSLAALAAGIPSELRLALIDAKRGEVFAALYRGAELLWPPFAGTPDALVQRVRDSDVTPLAAGDGSLRFRGTLEAGGIVVATAPAHVVRALHVCRLAEGVAATPADAVLPDYLREPDAKPQR
jgi:tRNA threonylcarbamoyladenosine biosynthesis protein TsaB